MACLAELQDGDRVAIRGARRGSASVELVGTVRAGSAGLRLVVENAASPVSYSLGRVLRPITAARSVPPLTIQGIDLLDTARQRRERRRDSLRGALAYASPPRSAGEIDEALKVLAREISLQLRAPRLSRRAKELLRQFHDVANMVDLPRTRRNYYLFQAAAERGVAPILDLTPRHCVAPTAEDLRSERHVNRRGCPSLFPARRPVVSLDPEQEIRRLQRMKLARLQAAGNGPSSDPGAVGSPSGGLS